MSDVNNKGCETAGEAASFSIESIITVDERGQMVLPKEVRARAGIRPGEKLVLVVWERKGEVCCMALIRTHTLQGLVKEILGPVLGEPHRESTHVPEETTKEVHMDELEIKKTVRNRYAQAALHGGSCCGPSPSCCGGQSIQSLSELVGYSKEEIMEVPEGANLGLGCGNPVALASLKDGETVLDLGSGAGFDCFLAAKRVGPRGRVIGVDMTPEMVQKARENARKGGFENVEFRLGEIEHLPAPDNSVDVIISNCVINLVPDKAQVFREAYRVLKPGGRIVISDIVVDGELPEVVRSSVAAYVGCVAGALEREKYVETIKGAGFEEVEILEETGFHVDHLLHDPVIRSAVGSLELPEEEIQSLSQKVRSIRVMAKRPK